MGRRLSSSDSAHTSGEERVHGGDGGVGRGGGARFDPPGPHVGEELVRDLGQHLLGQAGHAEDVVSPPVYVVSEGDKLGEGGTKMRTWRGKEKREDRKIDKRKIYIY